VRGLLLRLSSLDADVESAIRLISFFDSLLEQEVKLDELLRSAAIVADCAVGVQDLDGQFAARAHPDGTSDAERAPLDAAVRAVSAGHHVWLGRSGADASPLDELMLERLAIACIATLGRGDTPSPILGDPALLELAVGRSTAAPERTRAIHLLGLKPCTELTLLAVLGPLDGVDKLAAQLVDRGARPIRAIIGSVHAMAIVGTAPDDLTAPDGVAVGIGITAFAVDAPTSWDKALRALRYTTATTGRPDPGAHPVVFASHLGPFELLAAQIRSADIRGVTDIDVIDELASEPNGPGILTALSVVVEAGSLREAARQLHLHHNSVSARLARAEERLGYRVTEPRGLARLQLALALRRLRDTDLLA
jgi:hypothetical protein